MAISTKFTQSWGRHLASLAASSVVGLGNLNFEQLKVLSNFFHSFLSLPFLKIVKQEMRLPGGNILDSVIIAGVVVEGEVLLAPRECEKMSGKDYHSEKKDKEKMQNKNEKEKERSECRTTVMPCIVLIDFEINTTQAFGTNITNINDIDIWSKYFPFSFRISSSSL